MVVALRKEVREGCIVAQAPGKDGHTVFIHK